MTVILEDNSDVHVDHDQKADDQVGEQKGYGHDGVAAVTLISCLGVGWKIEYLFIYVCYKIQVTLGIYKLLKIFVKIGQSARRFLRPINNFVLPHWQGHY